MKAMVVYDSAYGNTEQVARAIAAALEAAAEVTTARANEVTADQLAGLDLLVVGSPTQKFSPTPAASAFVKRIPANALRGVKVAAFDTRFTQGEIDKVRVLAFFVKLFGYAAEPLAGRLVKKGGRLALPAQGFYVGDTEGPLLDGELERAASWAQEIIATN